MHEYEPLLACYFCCCRCLDIFSTKILCWMCKRIAYTCLYAISLEYMTDTLISLQKKKLNQANKQQRSSEPLNLGHSLIFGPFSLRNDILWHTNCLQIMQFYHFAAQNEFVIVFYSAFSLIKQYSLFCSFMNLCIINFE